MSNTFVVCMGVGTVFVGLVSIVFLSVIMSLICRATEKKSKPEAVAAATSEATIENRREIIAAVSAAIAEDMGTDISAVRILSFKKL